MTYFYYRLCVKVSNNNENISILVTVITMSLLAINYITTRPQIFTYLNLILDDLGGIAGMETRIESFVDIFEN